MIANPLGRLTENINQNVFCYYNAINATHRISI